MVDFIEKQFLSEIEKQFVDYEEIYQNKRLMQTCQQAQVKKAVYIISVC